ncbi:MAG: sulfotransferase domain-containing protein [Chromatiales bacterium]|nr:sulfotransferase domain-containing protein [Chromatiales bacterium]
MLPNFLIIGAPKAATTWLADCLREHPDIFIPELKELRYFCGANHGKGLAWYQQHFDEAQGAAVVGEASPSYLGSLAAPQRIHELLPQARLILSLRHPVDQAYSFYWHLMSRGHISCNTEFSRFFVEQRPRAGYYGYNVSRYLEYFDSSQMLILVYEKDVQPDPSLGIKRCQAFLGVDTTHIPSVLVQRRNAGKDIRVLNGPAQMVRKAINYLPRSLTRSVKRLGRISLQMLPARTRYRPLDFALRRQLAREYCLSDIKRLEGMAGMDLSVWYDG